MAALHKHRLFLYARSDGGYRSMEVLIAAHAAARTGFGNSAIVDLP